MMFKFVIGEPVQMRFAIGGAPAPAPAPVAVYDNWAGVTDPCLTGFVTDEWGTLPYRLVEYIKSNGTQYVLTDVVPTYDTETELDCKFTITNPSASNTPFFGIQASNAWYLGSLEGPSYNSRNCSFYIGYSWRQGISSSITINNVQYSQRNIVTCQHPQSSYGNASTTITETITQGQPDVGVSFCGVTATGGSSGRAFDVGEMYLYGATMYDNGTLTHAFVPAERKSDYELGLYDVVTGKFYGNSGTGTFERGKYLLQ